MFFRQITSRATRIIRPVVRNSSQYVPPPHIKQVVMNDCLVPSGSWQEGYDKLQKKFNLQLIAGVTFFVATVSTAIASGTFQFFLTPSRDDVEDIKC